MARHTHYPFGSTLTERDTPTVSTDRPSTFREMLYRDRPLVTRGDLDRRIADRAAERELFAAVEGDQAQTNYLPTTTRVLNQAAAAPVRAGLVALAIVVGAFLFGRWVGQQTVPDPAPEMAAVSLAAG